MKKRTKIILGILAVISAAVCLACCVFIWQYFRGSQLNERMEQHISTSVVVEESDSESEEAPELLPEWFIAVDFESLAEVNEDIYAWINIPETNINYAVVQSPTDDLFYNDHGVDKAYYSGGSIFSQRYNTKTFEDPVTVLYGHNRKSETMFAQVNNYADPEFFEAHPYIYIYTPDRVYVYQIFAAFPHSSEHLLVCHDFTDPDQFNAFFENLGGSFDSNYREELFPSSEDHVLTLSTCYRNNRMQRYLVQGVLQMEYLIETEVQ